MPSAVFEVMSHWPGVQSKKRIWTVKCNDAMSRVKDCILVFGRCVYLTIRRFSVYKIIVTMIVPVLFGYIYALSEGESVAIPMFRSFRLRSAELCI